MVNIICRSQSALSIEFCIVQKQAPLTAACMHEDSRLTWMRNRCRAEKTTIQTDRPAEWHSPIAFFWQTME